MIFDIADPEFNAKELFKAYCEADEEHLSRHPVNCFAASRLQEWIIIRGERINNMNPIANSADKTYRMAELIIEVWLRIKLISISGKTIDQKGNYFSWYEIKRRIR